MEEQPQQTTKAIVEFLDKKYVGTFNSVPDSSGSRA